MNWGDTAAMLSCYSSDSRSSPCSKSVALPPSSPTIALYLYRDLDRAHDSAIQQSLKEMKKQIPDPRQDWNEFNQWWQDNGSIWTEQLRTVLIEHRNIGHHWQFSDTQKAKLQQYYNANKLLVDCLNSDCYVSREVREQIEESLLLPVAPIAFVPPE